MKKNLINIVQDDPDASAPNPFSSLKITDEALYKAILLSRIFQEEINKDSEIGGIQLNFKNKHDGVTRDVNIGYKQSVMHSEVVYPEFLETINEGFDNKKYKVVGLWHSHAGRGVSQTSQDDDILRIVYSMSKRFGKENVIQLNTLDVESPIETEIDGDYLKILLGNNPMGVKLSLSSMPNEVREYLLNLNSAHLLLPIALFYASSIVINNSCLDYDLNEMDKLKSRINYSVKTLHQTFQNLDGSTLEEGVTLDIVHERNGICLDEDILREQILERLKYENNSDEVEATPEQKRFIRRKISRKIEQERGKREEGNETPIDIGSSHDITRNTEESQPDIQRIDAGESQPDISRRYTNNVSNPSSVLTPPVNVETEAPHVKIPVNHDNEKPVPQIYHNEDPHSQITPLDQHNHTGDSNNLDGILNGGNNIVNSNSGTIDDVLFTKKARAIENNLNKIGEDIKVLEKEVDAMTLKVRNYLSNSNRRRNGYSDFVKQFYYDNPETQNERFVTATAKLVNKEFHKHYLQDLKYDTNYSEIDFIPPITDWKRIKKAIKYLYHNTPENRGYHNHELEQIAEAVEVNPEAIEAGVADDIAYTIRKKSRHMHLSEMVNHYVRKAIRKVKKKTGKSTKEKE